MIRQALPLSAIVLGLGSFVLLASAGCVRAGAVQPASAATPSPAPGGEEVVADTRPDVPWPLLVGEWHGALQAGAQTLRLGLTIAAEGDNAVARWRNVDRPGAVIEVARLQRKGVLLTIATTGPDTSFVGAYVAADVPYIDGTFSQNGHEVPLRLTQGAFPAPSRPQMPTGALPYRSEEVGFENSAAKITLGGTLTLPNTAPGARVAAVVLITGSGQQDRDETIAGHKPFLVLADVLTRRGFAVLRLDDRGVGASTGDFSSSTSADFASDIAAAVGYLKTRSDIDASRIGLLGHSEGGMIAPMVAKDRPKDIAFVVLMAGISVGGEAILKAQSEAIGAASGLSADELRFNRVVQAAAIAASKRKAPIDVVEADLRAQLERELAEMPADKRAALIDSSMQRLAPIRSPWFQFFLTYDPLPALRALKVPTLAIFGELDLQVLPAQHLEPMKKALAKNKRATVVVLPGKNHLMQSARTGAIEEYEQIEETLSVEFIETLGGWLAANVGGATAP